MAYYPKSKHHVETSSGQYRHQDGSPYYGPVVVTYDERVFPGEKFHDGAERLSLPEEPGETYIVTGSVAKKRYPTGEERQKGSMDRYFQQDYRTKKVVEIYPEDYSSSILSSSTLFSYATASWCLGGRPVEDEVFVTGLGRRQHVREGLKTYNSRSIADLERIFPGISSSGVLCNPLEYIE